jgi:hypothetical protein
MLDYRGWKMSSHTPGPWVCHEQGVPNHYAFILDKGKWLCAIQFNGEQLVETQNANAKLIATSPDLLNALCLALPFVEDALYDESYKPERVQKVIDTIKNAITKANA